MAAPTIFRSRAWLDTLALSILSAGIVLAAASAHATPVVGSIETWTNGLAGWTETGDGTLSNPSDFLRLTFPAVVGGGPPVMGEDFMFNNTAGYTGDYTLTPGLSLKFDYRSVFFLTDNTLRFTSTNGHIWDLGFENVSTNTWESHTVSFDYDEYGGWVGGTEEEFLSDLRSIGSIGVYVQSVPATDDAQYYDLDNWEYMVPEPGTICMLGSVLISFGLTQRKRLRDLYRQTA